MRQYFEIFILAMAVMTSNCPGARGDYVLEYASPDSVTFAEISEGTPGFEGGRDLNDDGRMEIISEKRQGEYGQPRTYHYAAIDGSTHQMLWSWTHSVDANEDMLFFGFLDLDADGQKEGLFAIEDENYVANTEILALDWTSNSIEWSHFVDPDLYVGHILDIDGDGYYEIVLERGHYPLGFEIWGSGDGVSVPTQTAGIYLSQNYPNPFNPNTRIEFSLEKSGRVVLKIYDSTGRLVKTLLDGYREAGPLSVIWNGTDENGRRQSTGVYLFELHGDGDWISRKMLLIK